MELIHLNREKWAGYALPMDYESTGTYKISSAKDAEGYVVTVRKESLPVPFVKQNAFDKLYADYHESPYAWGFLEKGELVAAIETSPENWSNRLRVTELYVHPDHRRKGLAHRLMNLAKEQLRRERRRGLILETQSSNLPAISFYEKEGFSLMGFDLYAYSNTDLSNNEVRLEFGWFPAPKRRLPKEEVLLLKETPPMYHDVEAMTMRAFWNKHHLGCDEHYLVHKIRQHPDYVEELTRVAVIQGQVAGAIFYTKSKVQSEESETELLTFGPLCVDPKWQGQGIGEMLVQETASLARTLGYPGIVIFGEPDYYPRLGFKTCDQFGITTRDGKNFDAFMALELSENALDTIHGNFHESPVFEDLAVDKVEEYTRKFDFLEKTPYPDQWD